MQSPLQRFMDAVEKRPSVVARETGISAVTIWRVRTKPNYRPDTNVALKLVQWASDVAEECGLPESERLTFDSLFRAA